MSILKVGVFPLKNIILYPHTHLPLIVQDPNYVQMIKDSARLNFCIAIGLGDTVRDTYGRVLPKLLRPKKVFGLGKVELVEEYEDGSIFVIFHGIGKCSLRDIHQHVPYLVCEADLIQDTQEGFIELPKGTLSRLTKLLTKWLVENIDDQVYLEAIKSELNQIDRVVSHICAFMIKDRDLKQILLETYSLGERIRIIDALFPKEFQRQGQENPQLENALKSFESGEFLLAGTEQ